MNWNELVALYAKIGNVIPEAKEGESRLEYYNRMLIVIPRDQEITLLKAIFKDEFEALNDKADIHSVVIEKFQAIALAECIEFLKGLEHG